MPKRLADDGKLKKKSPHKGPVSLLPNISWNYLNITQILCKGCSLSANIYIFCLLLHFIGAFNYLTWNIFSGYYKAPLLYEIWDCDRDAALEFYLSCKKLLFAFVSSGCLWQEELKKRQDRGGSPREGAGRSQDSAKGRKQGRGRRLESDASKKAGVFYKRVNRTGRKLSPGSPYTPKNALVNTEFIKLRKGLLTVPD